MYCILKHKNIDVALLDINNEDGDILKIKEVYDTKRLPVGVPAKKDTADIDKLRKWWRDRSIPASRTGINEALAILGVPHTLALVTKCYGLSLSDHYWIKSVDEDLYWEDINFFENSFSEDIGNILLGKESHSSPISLHAPDNTSDGCLKKRWKIINGRRCLIKGGSKPFLQQPFNEVIATNIAKVLGIPHIQYWLMWDGDTPYSVCEDFVTVDTELVSAWRIVNTKKKSNSDSYYRHYVKCCEEKGLDVVDSLNKMIVLDYIIGNEDRHMNNFGIVRDANTLEWIGAADIYDSGTALGYDKLSNQIRSGRDVVCKPFKEDHDKQIRLVTDFSWIDFSALENVESIIRNVLEPALEKTEVIDEERISAIVFIVKQRIEKLKNYAALNQIKDDIREDLKTNKATTYDK